MRAIAVALTALMLGTPACGKGKPAASAQAKKVNKAAGPDDGKKAATEPAKKPKTEPVPKPNAEPAQKPKAEPAEKPKAEPAEKPKAEPAEKPKAETAEKPKAKTAVPNGDWCVILGAYPPKKLERALAAAAKAVEKGFSKAAVYAGDDFANLAWGGVVAIAMFGDKKSARTSAKAVKKAKLKGFAKKCIRLRAPKVLKTASDLPKPKAFAGTPLTWKVGNLREGKRPCFAWSPKTQTGLCSVASFDSLELDKSVSHALYWVTAKGRTKVTSKDKALVKKLAADGFKAWDDAALGTRNFARTKVVRWAVPQIVSVKWSRQTELVEMESDSDRVAKVKSHDDLVEVTCNGGGDTAIKASPYADSGQPFATLLPGGRAILVEWLETSWVAGEGHMGNRQDAVVLDLDKACGLDE